MTNYSNRSGTESTNRKENARSRKSAMSVLLGLGVPVIAIMVVLPILSGYKITIAGLPFVYFWLFLWFPLTFICLWLSWQLFDKNRYDG